MTAFAAGPRWVMSLGLSIVLVVAASVCAQNDGDLGSLLGGSGGGNVVTVSAVIVPAAEGKPAELAITATIKSPWHIYSITQPPGGPLATKIKLTPSSDYRLVGDFTTSPPPEKKKEPVFDNLTVESHHGNVTWRAPLEFAPGVDPAKLRIEGAVNAMPCDPKSCLPPQDFPFVAALGRPTIAISPPAPPASPVAPPPALPTQSTMPPTVAAPPGPALQPGAAAPPQPTAPPAVTAPPSSAPVTLQLDRLEIAANKEVKATPMWLILVMGFAGGLILNIMPCVLPVIGLKILSFVEQSGHSRQHAMVLNVWYALGMMAVFMALAALAVFAHYGWGQLFQLSAFNITLAAVVFVMAISFLGVWEVPIPGFVGAGKAAEWGQREGAVGAFAKGVLTTILATPCSAPFLGSALAWAVGQEAPRAFAVFGAAGLGMASPYLLLGAFPELLRFLPKPGEWMETFKQVMGFVLLGTVVYLLTFIPWACVVPTVGLLFGLWAACWWIGRVPATASFSTKFWRWTQAVLFAAAVGGVMFPGIDGLFEGRFAFGGLREAMESRFNDAVSGTDKRFTTARFQRAVASRKTVLVDFTADWCLTCKTLEAQVLNAPAVRQRLDDDGIVMFKADWTHRDPEVTAMLEALGSNAVPVIAIFPAADPNRPIVFRDGYTQEGLLAALKAAGR